MSKDTNIKKVLGKRIQKIRKSKGLTQGQLAEIVSLSDNYISDIECGKSYVRIDKLIRIINGLQCSADDIFIDLIDCGYKIKSSHLAERLESISKEDQAKALELLSVFIGESK